MSNQEPQNQSNAKEKAVVDKRRRFIKGVGVAAPVALTLTSPSVFGAFCLSEIMSGNESHHGTGSCALGNNAAYWGNTANAWPAGYSRDTPTDCTGTGGTTFDNPTLAFGSGADAFSNSPSTASLQAILCDPIANAAYVEWVVALLNSVGVPNFILTKQQLLDLYHFDAPPPPYPNTAAGKIAFLATTHS